MSGDIETEQLLFVGKLFVIAPRRDRSSSCRCYRRGDFIEQRDLACGPIAMRGRGRDERLIDAGKKFRALATKKIERAGFNQTLEHFSICDAGAKSPAKILQRSEISAALPFADRHLHRALADMLDRGQSISDRHRPVC